MGSSVSPFCHFSVIFLSFFCHYESPIEASSKWPWGACDRFPLEGQHGNGSGYCPGSAVFIPWCGFFSFSSPKYRNDNISYCNNPKRQGKIMWERNKRKE